MKKILLSLAVCAALPLVAQTNSLEVTLLGQKSYAQTLNDVWGYATAAKEYALVGTTGGLSIVDVTNPAAPVEKHFISGTNSTWRDIKTYGHYAYVVHDSYFGPPSDGIMIVDLNTIDSATISVVRKYPVVNVSNNNYTFDRAHNIYIDENGVLYAFGANAGNGGALMFDITGTHDTNPSFLGAYDGTYFHDGVARGDTLWGGAIYAGEFRAIDVSSKTSPVLMGSHSTPNAFCHNIWFSDDNQTVFTTDEKTGAYVTAYDVSDFANITELDRIRTTIYDPTQVIPHNTHVMGDFLVTSYYTSGLQIVDASIPGILVETAYYDTSPLTGNGYSGAWGAYPYLPSGNILVSDMEEGLFILESTYPHACYLSVFVKDSVTGNPIVNADIELLNTDIGGKSDIFGKLKDGQRDTGTYQLVVEKAGYYTDTITVQMNRGVLLNQEVALLPVGFGTAEASRIAGVSVFPNPSSGRINILLPELDGPETGLKIRNTSGQLLYSHTFHAEKLIEVETKLPPGIYLLDLSNGRNKFTTQRLIVNP